MFWCIMKKIFFWLSWLSGLLSAEIFISTGECGVQMPPLTSENSHFLRSGPQEATLVMCYGLVVCWCGLWQGSPGSDVVASGSLLVWYWAGCYLGPWGCVGGRGGREQLQCAVQPAPCCCSLAAELLLNGVLLTCNGHTALSHCDAWCTCSRHTAVPVPMTRGVWAGGGGVWGSFCLDS